MAWYIDSEHVMKNERKEGNPKYEKIWKPEKTLTGQVSIAAKHAVTRI